MMIGCSYQQTIIAIIVAIPCNCFLNNELQINYSLAF